MFAHCAIYTRQSGPSDDDLSSCEVQYEACRDYIRSMRGAGWLLIGERFDDNGYLGATLDRPALTRLRDLVKARKIDILVVHRMDRLVRSLLSSATVLEELRQYGVRLVIVTAAELGSAAQDKFMLNILASFAEFERELIASRIAESRARLKARGLRIAGAVPINYDADLPSKQLVVNQKDAAIVRWMFTQASADRCLLKSQRERTFRAGRRKSGSGREVRRCVAATPGPLARCWPPYGIPFTLAHFRSAVAQGLDAMKRSFRGSCSLPLASSCYRAEHKFPGRCLMGTPGCSQG